MEYTKDGMVLAGFKKKLVIRAGIALGAVLLLAIFIFVLNSNINTRVEAITNAKGELALREKTIELLTGTNSDLKKAEPLFVNLQNFLPDKDQLINFPRELQQVGKTYAVDVGFSFGVEEAAKGDEPGLIRFTMTVAGSYDDIVDFFKYVEGHHYLIQLDSIDIRRSSEKDFSLLTSGEIYTK